MVWIVGHGGVTFIMIGVDILSQQDDFFDPLRFIKPGGFLYDAVEFSGPFPSSGEGHDAIGAHVVASSHDGYKGGNVVGIGSYGCDIGVCFFER